MKNKVPMSNEQAVAEFERVRQMVLEAKERLLKVQFSVSDQPLYQKAQRAYFKLDQALMEVQF
jgi:hypothetical protein